MALELDTERVRLHERDRQAAGFVLARGHASPLLRALEAEDVAVEPIGLFEIAGWHGDEIDPGDFHTRKVRDRARGVRGKWRRSADVQAFSQVHSRGHDFTDHDSTEQRG